jgi:hypothetical protein
MGEQQKVKEEMLQAVRERVFYLNTLTSHAGGQKQAQRISKLVTKCTHILRKLLTQYSQLGQDNGDVRQYTIEEVFNLESPFWVCGDHSYAVSADPTSVIPPAYQWRLIELHRLEAQSKEELQLLIAESLKRVDVYTTKLNWERAKSLSCAGHRALCILKCHQLEFHLHRSKLVNKALIQAYWSPSNDQAKSTMSAKRQCEQSFFLPSQPLLIHESLPVHVQVPQVSSDQHAHENSDESSTSADENQLQGTSSSEELSLSDSLSK